MNSTLDLRGRLFVTPAEALYCPEFLGLPVPQNPDEAARALLKRGRFPLPTVKIARRRMVRVATILAFGQAAQPAAAGVQDMLEAGLPVPPRRKPGRPTNLERAARAAHLAAGEVGHD